MSIIKTIPASSRFIQVDAIFDATFNDVVLGKYSYNTTQNLDVVLLEPLTNTSIYLIDRYSFSSQIPEGVFLESIEEVPTAQLTKRIDGMPIFQKPIPCINYVDNGESLGYFWSKQGAKEQDKRDALTVSFRGVLNQTAETVGIPVIRCLLSIQLYEIVDKNFTEKIRTMTIPTSQSIQVF